MPTASDPVATDAAPAAIGPYSQAVRAGNLVFCSGQIPLDPATGDLVEGGPGAQTARCLENLAAVAEAAGGSLLLGAVGQLQFEVVAHRLKTEYGVDARMMPSRYTMARWITSDNPKALRKFMDANAAHIAYDVVDAAAFLISSPAQLRVAEELYPDVKFHAMREHGGKVFGDKA